MIGFDELRKSLGITRSKLTKWVKEGLPHEVKKRKKRFDAETVRRWLIENGKASAPSSSPAAVHTRQDCASHFGVAVRTVADWLKDPEFPGRAGNPGRRDGFYPLELIAEWRQRKFGDEGKDNPRDRLADIRAKIAEVDYLERIGEVVSAEEVERFMSRTIATAKSVLDQLPGEVAAILPDGITDADKSKVLSRARKVLDESYSALADLTQWKEAAA